MQFIDEKYKRASDKGVVEKEWPIVLFFCKSLRVLLSFSICPYPDIKQNKIKLQYPKLQATHNVWDNSKQKFREFLRMPFSFFYPDAPCPCSAFMSQQLCLHPLVFPFFICYISMWSPISRLPRVMLTQKSQLEIHDKYRPLCFPLVQIL